MMKIVNILLIALGVMLLSSCTKEPMGGNEPQPEGTVQIKFALSDNGAAQPTTPSRAGETDAGDPAESRIRYLKVLFYNIGATDETSTLESSSMYDLTPQNPDSENDPIDKGFFNWNPVTKVLTFRFYATEKYKVVVIANWGDPNWFKKVQNIKALDECFTNIDAKDAYNLANGSTPLILMSGAIEHNFKMNPRATMPLIRQLVRIDLNVTFNADFMKAYPGLKFYDDSEMPDETCPLIYFYNVPNCSHISDTKGSNPKFVELLKQPDNHMSNFSTVRFRNGNTDMWKKRSYAYENLTFGKITDNAETRKNAPFMVIRLPYTLKEGDLTTTVTENYYKFYINDLSPAAAASPHKTVRNHLYRVGVEVTGFGGATPNDDYIRVTTEVLPWNSVLVSDEQGEFLKMDERDKTITLGQETAIRVTANNLDLMSIVSEKGNVTWRVVKDTDGSNQQDWKGTIFVSIKPEATGSEFVSGVDKLTAKVGRFSQSVTLNHVPCMAQRFARGMLVSDGAGGVTIGAPNSNPKQNLLFKFGRPMGMLSHAANDPLTLVYNPSSSSWPTVQGTIFNPVAQPFFPAYSGDDKDYMEKQIDANGWCGADAGDVCRIMGQTDGHFWRIPTKNEWKALVAEGKKAISMNGQPLQGSNVPTADFGWFCGPTAQQGTEATAGTPPKGSVFVYNLSYGSGSTPITVHSGTLNIGTSSLYDPSATNFDEQMGYVTANGLYIDPESSLNVWQHSVAIRCIRDYEREKTLPKR